MSTWYVFFADTCPHTMSDLSKAWYYKGLDKTTCPSHLSEMSVSMVELSPRNQSLDKTYLSKPKNAEDLKHEENYYRILFRVMQFSR